MPAPDGPAGGAPDAAAAGGAPPAAPAAGAPPTPAAGGAPPAAAGAEKHKHHHLFKGDKDMKKVFFGCRTQLKLAKGEYKAEAIADFDKCVDEKKGALAADKVAKIKRTYKWRVEHPDFHKHRHHKHKGAAAAGGAAPAAPGAPAAPPADAPAAPAAPGAPAAPPADAPAAPAAGAPAGPPSA